MRRPKFAAFPMAPLFLTWVCIGASRAGPSHTHDTLAKRGRQHLPSEAY